jgi:hypothetical protein
MNNLKVKFSDFTSEYLLELRARGNDLSDEAHQAIEEIFSERGEYLPTKPKTPIFAAPASNAGNFFKAAALIILAPVGIGMAKALAHTWIGVLVTVCVVIYFVANWIRRQKLTPAQREREDNEKKTEEEGLTEIMVCAANGNLERIRELVEYGANINDKTASGTTALMYAARNNHLAIIEFLLSAGANPRLKSDKKVTAADIARKFGHMEIATFLEKQDT